MAKKKTDDATPESSEQAADTQSDAPKRTVEAIASERATPSWLFAAAKALHAWPNGMEVTDEEFAVALVAAANVQIR